MAAEEAPKDNPCPPINNPCQCTPLTCAYAAAWQTMQREMLARQQELTGSTDLHDQGRLRAISITLIRMQELAVSFVSSASSHPGSSG
jgi:hypothetical protein